MQTNPLTVNLLPQDGATFYLQQVFTLQQTAKYYSSLFLNIAWQQDEVLMFGKRITTKRKVAWYGDKNFAYTYSHTTREALPFTKELLEIKKVTELITGETYNACLSNLYHHGDEGMGWHSDDENTIVKQSAIASVSFGAARKFSLRHKLTKQVISLTLEPGSVLVMQGNTQTAWHHSLPKSKRILEPRINLTFRKMLE